MAQQIVPHSGERRAVADRDLNVRKIAKGDRALFDAMGWRVETVESTHPRGAFFQAFGVVPYENIAGVVPPSADAAAIVSRAESIEAAHGRAIGKAREDRRADMQLLIADTGITKTPPFPRDR